MENFKKNTKWHRVDKNIKKVWTISYILGYTIVLMFFFFLLILSNIYKWNSTINIIIIIILFIVIICMIIEYIYIKIYKYNIYKFKITNSHVFIQKKGWFNFIEKTVPIEKIYYIDIYEGPILKRYNLCTLKFGTIAYTHEIEGININQVNSYKKQIYKDDMR
ncbi:PH domain-containing protein [Staphylococcus epidermidis]|uniref:PH domain-containing protein n=2 Tax=Staphylococcus epidermidis TaxID=1282 RepID=UPI0038799CC2